MLYVQEYEFLKTKYNEYIPLYTDEPTIYLRMALNDLLEGIGMILKEYEYECDEMAKLYEEQEKKMNDNKITNSELVNYTAI